MPGVAGRSCPIVRADGLIDQDLDGAGRQKRGQTGLSRQADKVLPGLSAVERDELSRQRRESKQLRVERDILSKAAAWFARA